MQTSWVAVHGGPSGGAEDAQVKYDFSVSLNAFGPSPVVVEAIRRAPVDVYPDPTSTAARQVAAARWTCTVDEILFGAGASELIDAVARAFISPGNRVVIAEPTYGEYRRAAMLAGGDVVGVPWEPSTFAVRCDDVEKCIRITTPRLTFVCAPNNPTGQLFTRADLERIANACQSAGGLLVLDQSYDAFTECPLGTPALCGHPAVVHIRSITKEHAVAGVRAGFLVAPANVVRAVERVRAPWSASTIAQAAAAAALDAAGLAHVARTVPELRKGRASLAAVFARYGVPVLSGGTHTLLARVGDASAFRSELLQAHGIRVRDCTSFGLPEFVRVAARTPSDNEALEMALQALLSKRPARTAR
jgi:histidinol-phosphate aminotransferase